jgi:apolipoprotein N-acyltransferase
LRIWPLGLAALVLAATLLYGHWRMAGRVPRSGPRVAIVQGSIDADWKADPSKTRRIFEHYYRLSRRAVAEAGDRLDLVLWPETMFPHPLVTIDPNDPPAPAVRSQLAELRDFTTETVAALAQRLGAPMLLGVATWQYGAAGVERFNSAVLTDRQGRVVARYDKIHLVMFGEYVPLGRLCPSLYEWTPLTGGVSPGASRPVLPRYRW